MNHSSLNYPPQTWALNLHRKEVAAVGCHTLCAPHLQPKLKGNISSYFSNGLNPNKSNRYDTI